MGHGEQPSAEGFNTLLTGDDVGLMQAHVQDEFCRYFWRELQGRSKNTLEFR